MSSAQHLLVLMSIILGFGIRDLLVGGRAAAMIRPWKSSSILPFFAGTLVLVAIVQFWWYLFIVANRGVWGENFFLFAATLLRPGLLFLSAASIFPPPDGQRDLAAHYFRNRGFIYLPLAIFEGQNFIESAVNLGTVFHPAHLFHLVFIAISVALAVSASARRHLQLLALLLVLVAMFIATFSLRLE